MEFETLDDYFSWCRQVGFPAAARKSEAFRHDELRFWRATQELETVGRDIRHHALIVLRCLRFKSVALVRIGILFRNYRGLFDLHAVPDLIVALARRTSVFYRMDEVYEADIVCMARLSRLHAQWVGRLENYRTGATNVRGQLIDLVRHLLVRYEMPRFFDAVWFSRPFEGPSENDAFRDWYIAIGRGDSHRDLPVRLSPRESHLLMQAPDYLDMNQAIRWSKVVAFGVSREVAEAVIATGLRNIDCSADGYRPVVESLFRWLAANPDFPRDELGGLVDWLLYERFHTEPGIDDNGRVITLGPRQPHLSMRGRTVRSALRSIETDLPRSKRWFESRRRELAQLVNAAETEVVVETPELAMRPRWLLRRITSVAELVDEGDRMSHCVGEYTNELAEGHQFWSMCPVGLEEDRSARLTVALSPDGLTELESAGFANRDVDDDEYEAISKWLEHRRAVSAALTK